MTPPTRTRPRPRFLRRRRPPGEERAHLKRLLAVVAAVALAVAIASSDALHTEIRELVALAEGVVRAHSVEGAVVFVALSAVSAMLAFFSSALVVPVGIAVWGETTTFLLLWLGWLLGGVASYVVGRHLGRRVAAWIADPERLAYYEERLSRRAGFPLILLFQLALPSEIPGYVLGVLHYRFATYVAALALGELPYALGTVYLGESFMERRYLLLGVLGLAGAALSAVALLTLYRRLERRGG